MNVSGLLFLIFTQFLAGRGLLAIFNIRQRLAITISVSMICGVMIFSLIPFLLELAYIPITAMSVGIAISVIAAMLFLIPFRRYDFSVFRRKLNLAMPAYEVFFIVVLAGLALPSIWRCYFYPPFARDVLSGPEPVAEFAVREHTLLNSVLTLNLESTNNHLKPPFITDLQIIYKLFVHPFGQLWLSIIFISFMVWLYVLLKEKLHPIIAGVAMLFLIAMPEMYAHTYIILYDYSNMVIYFAGIYYLARYAETKQYNLFLFACLMFGFATFIRSETLVFVGMLVPVLSYQFWKEKTSIIKILVRISVFVLVPFIFYYAWMGIFITYYMPVPFDLDNHITIAAERLPLLWERFKEMHTKLFFAPENFYGYLIVFFAVVLLADAMLIRSFNREAKIVLCGILVIYVGLPVLGYLIPWVDLYNTTKRGLFKLLPLMVLYLRDSGLLVRLSAKIKAFEFPVAPVKVPAKQMKNRTRRNK